MLNPGPDHPITVTPAQRRWRVRFAGHVIADSNDALILEEADHPARIYFPRADVSMEYMARTDHLTCCPYKGEANYYSLLMDGNFADNAIWTYEQPGDAVAAIAGRLAFYPEQVELYDVDDAAVNPRRADALGDTRVDAVVQHTDAGDGNAQRERWTPNVARPGPDGGVT